MTLNRIGIKLATAVLAVMVLPLMSLTAQTRTKPSSASAAVQQFIQAAADSNLVLMSQLWGSDDGSAHETGKPGDFQKRMVIMQAMLRGAKSRTLGEVATREEHRVSVTTELAKGKCKVVIAVIAVDSDDGWLVSNFDLPRVWEGINTPCVGSVGGNR